MLFKVFKVIVIEQEFFSLVASNFFSSDVFSDNIKEDLEFFIVEKGINKSFCKI